MTKRLATGPAIIAIALLLALLALNGCGGSQSSSVPPAKRLATAQHKLEQTAGVHVSMATKQLPRGVSGVLNASGTGTREQTFRGSITVVNNGISLPVPVVAVDGRTYVNFGGWRTIDPGKFGAPDPGALFGPRGFAALFASIDNVRAGEDIRSGEDVFSTLQGTVNGSEVAHIMPSATTGKPFRVQLQLDDSNTLRRAVVTGPFYPQSGDVSYTIDLSNYGAHPRITPPTGVQ